MIDDDEEEASWSEYFKGKFTSREGTEKRLEAERKAGRTEKQRERQKSLGQKKKKQMNVRLSDESRAQIDALAKHLDETATDVIRLAIDELAKAKLGTKK
jgi:hypothetical protein